MSSRLPSAVDLHVAARLRLRRQEVGMSLETLADALGVTYQQVQKYEKGTNRMSAGILYQMAMTLEVPVQYFFDELNAPSKRKRESGRLVKARRKS